jgi:hypothetical protein
MMSSWPVNAAAQALYRCGATYQDRPCAGVDSKVVSRGARRVEPSDGWAVEPMCRDRGVLAQKIMWEKESGRTLDEQLARNEVDANLIKKIYALRGSSVDVRRAIEADCAKELERPAEPAMSRVNTGNPPVLPPPVPAQDKAVSAQQAGVRTDGSPARAEAGAATKAQKCAAVSAELEGLKALQHNGGDAATMDELAARVRQAQSRKRAAGC